MANVEKYDDLIIGSGIAGKFAAWMRNSQRRTVIVKRGLLGGSCPNVACLPSKNLIWSAKVISLARRGMEFGLKTESLSIDMVAVQHRKRSMVRELRRVHEDHTQASGAELIYGVARFVAQRSVEPKTISEPRGLMKALVSKRNDQILGLTASGFEASEDDGRDADRNPRLTAVQVVARRHPDASDNVRGIESIADKHSRSMRPKEGLMNFFIRLFDRLGILKSGIDYHIIRASMILIFSFFGYQKWFNYEAQALIPYKSNGPLISWMYPAFGVRGARWFLGRSESIFGGLIRLGFWNKTAGALGAIGAIASFVCTTTIIPFIPDGWAASAGGFPAMTERVAFLMKDFTLLAISFYLFKHHLLKLSLQHEDIDSSAARPSGILSPADTFRRVV